VVHAVSGGYARSKGNVQRTWANIPLGLETGHACEAGHGDKVEERLRDTEHDHWLGDDHLKSGILSRGAGCDGEWIVDA